MAPIPNQGPRRWVARAVWTAAVLLGCLPFTVVAQGGDTVQVLRAVGLSGSEVRLGDLNGPMGVAVSPGDDGRVFVVDRGNARVHVFSAAGGVIGAWGSRGRANNQFFLPADIALSPDGRYAYVVDQGLRQVKRFDVSPECFEVSGRDCFHPARVVVFGFHGGPDNPDDSGALQDPTGIAVGRDGRVYVADRVLHKIVVFDANGVALDRFGEPGSDKGQLLNPTDVAAHPDGSIWVADTNNDRICYFSPEGKAEGLFTGGGKSGRLFRPTGVAIDAQGGFVVRDWEQSYQLPQAARFEAGTKKNAWTIPLGGDDPDSSLPFQGAAFTADGSVILTDPTATQNVLVLVTPDGQTSGWGGTRGRHPLQFDHPQAVAMDRHLMAVVDSGNRRVVVLDRLPDGEKFKAVLGLPYSVNLDLRAPAGVAIWRRGEDPDNAVLYIADSAQHSVYVASPMGDRLARWGDGAASSGPTGLKSPHGIAVAPNGEVVIADTANNRIVRRAPYPRDEVLGIIGRSGSGPGEMEYPIAVTVGPAGLVYVLEAVRNRVQAFTLDGAYVAQWPKQMRSDRNVEPGEIWMPQAVGGDGKHLFLLENDAPLDHVRVQVLDPRADVHLADSLLATFPEGPGPGLMQLWDPHGVAVASDGIIAVADSGNNRVVLYRWGDPAAPPPTAPPATPTPLPTDTPVPPRPTDPPATASPTDEPATATPLPTSAPLTATATASPTATGEPATPTATPTATPSGSPPPATPTALPLTPTAAPSASPTDPPSANTRPTPFGGGKRVYLPLLVRNFRVGSRWR